MSQDEEDFDAIGEKSLLSERRSNHSDCYIVSDRRGLHRKGKGLFGILVHGSGTYSDIQDKVGVGLRGAGENDAVQNC
jgi:hypothetical protein